MIALILLSLILSKSCAAQTVPVDKEVLKYLFNESARAYYLDKDLKLTDSIIVAQNEIIDIKDSLLFDVNSKVNIKNSQIAICDKGLISANAENKKLSKKVTLFKVTTISVAIIGTISTIYTLFR